MRLPRSGLTLVELLVVIFLVSLLISLLVPAVFYARSLSLQISSKNKIVALFIAAEQHASSHGGKLPSSVCNPTDPVSMATVQYILLWYMDGGKAYQENPDDLKLYPRSYSHPALVSPADYSLGSTHISSEPWGKLCSYPVNAQVFGRNANLPKSFADGTSHTILFSEHLANCNDITFQYTTNGNLVPPGFDPIIRRSTFADGGISGFFTFGDVYPITTKVAQISRPSVPGKTFQVRPSITDCDPAILQTPHSTLICGFADGSVRSLHPKMAENAFWALVTMDGREPAGSD